MCANGSCSLNQAHAILSTANQWDYVGKDQSSGDGDVEARCEDLPGGDSNEVALMEKWRLRETGNRSTSNLFDCFTEPHTIINILIWNCRGALKPKFKQIVNDLVS